MKKYFILLLVFIVLISFAKSNSEADKIVEQGRQYLKVYNPNKAIEYMNKAISIDPKNIKAHWYKAMAFEQLDKIEEEIKEYIIILEIDPNNTDVRRHLGLKKFYEKKYDEAIDIFNEILKIDKTEESAYYYKGICELFKNDYKKASKDIYKSLHYSKYELGSSSFLLYSYAMIKLNKKSNVVKLIRDQDKKPQHFWTKFILELFDNKITLEDFSNAIKNGEYDHSFYHRNEEELYKEKYSSVYYILAIYYLFNDNKAKSYLYFKKVINIIQDNKKVDYLISKKEINTKQDFFVEVLVQNLRLRESQNTNSKIVSKLNKNEKLLLIDLGDYETIDNIQGQWIKVQTDDKLLGWCFDGYCDYN